MRTSLVDPGYGDEGAGAGRFRAILGMPPNPRRRMLGGVRQHRGRQQTRVRQQIASIEARGDTAQNVALSTRPSIWYS